MRKRREKRENAVYHVIAKANRGEFILNERKMKELFIDVLEKARKKYSFVIKHFCIMSNHVHLIIQPVKKTDLSKLMQWVLSVFAVRFNRYFSISGHVWYDRFKSIIIRTLAQYYKTFLYISNNPVKAGLCNDIRIYDFSGIRFLRMMGSRLIEPPDNITKILFPEFSQLLLK